MRGQRRLATATHRRTVRQASALSGEAVDELTATLGRIRQELDDRWAEGRESDTELLRAALRGYCSLIDRILTR